MWNFQSFKTNNPYIYLIFHLINEDKLKIIQTLMLFPSLETTAWNKRGIPADLRVTDTLV